MVLAAAAAQEPQATQAPPAAPAQAEARPRLAGKDLTIDECLRLAALYNKTVVKAREEITRLGGQRIMNRSRFLPDVKFIQTYGRSEQEVSGVNEHTTDDSSRVRVTQRLFEFGKDTAADVSLRAEERQALYDLEEAMREALSKARVSFFRAILKRQQIEARRRLLKEFQEKYERVNARYDKRMVLEVDLLTARLNVLNEELQIANLEAEENTLRMQLMQQIGNPIGAYEVRLRGEYAPFSLPVEKCVQVGLENSTAVALAEEKVEEQRRQIRRLIWEFAPDTTLRAGVRDQGNTGELTLRQRENDVWAGDLALERYLVEPDAGLGTFGDTITARRGWYVTAEVTFPIFQGLSRQGRYQADRAALRKLMTDVEIKRDGVELEVRTAFQTVLQSRRTVDIQTETARISQERWQIKERLKAIGRVSDEEIETFRDRFFNDQSRLFTSQDQLLQAEESLRRAMRHFE
jgi:HAE1 family hydrophobic/amphiphilic exporter-1